MRRRSQESGSLDLLLDTVTNTFGGVFFVAVLVTMLLRVTGSKVRKVQGDGQPDTQAVQVRDARKAELHGLEAALSQHQSLLDALTTSDGKREYEELVKLRARFAQLAKERIDAQSRVIALDSGLLKSRTQRAATNSEIARELSRKGELERLIEQELNSRTRTVALPTLRKTDKSEFPILIRYGRFYSAYTPDVVLLKRRSLNEFVAIGEEEGVVGITPKPYRGIALDKSEACAEAISQRMNGIDKSRCYIAVAVWEDSFGEFAHMRQILVDAEFEYRLLPIPSGQKIWEGGAGETFVQ